MKPKKKSIPLKRWIRSFLLKILSYLPPKETLRVLFLLDKWLYYLQSQIAINYGGGVHPKHRLTRYHNFFIERIQPGERILDIGCGIGTVAYDIAENTGGVVVGIDLNPQSILLAQNKYRHPRLTFEVGDALVSLPDGSFDTVILSNILEHLPDRTVLIKKILEKLNPSRILFRVPLFERDWRVSLKKELGVEWRLDPTHEVEYTLESFTTEVISADMEIIHLEIRWGEIWAEAIPCKSSD